MLSPFQRLIIATPVLKTDQVHGRHLSDDELIKLIEAVPPFITINGWDSNHQFDEWFMTLLYPHDMKYRNIYIYICNIHNIHTKKKSSGEKHVIHFSLRLTWILPVWRLEGSQNGHQNGNIRCFHIWWKTSGCLKGCLKWEKHWLKHSQSTGWYLGGVQLVLFNAIHGYHWCNCGILSSGSWDIALKALCWNCCPSFLGKIPMSFAYHQFTTHSPFDRWVLFASLRMMSIYVDFITDLKLKTPAGKST